jgi:hypothetical protein
MGRDGNSLSCPDSSVVAEGDGDAAVESIDTSDV